MVLLSSSRTRPMSLATRWTSPTPICCYVIECWPLVCQDYAHWKNSCNILQYVKSIYCVRAQCILPILPPIWPSSDGETFSFGILHDRKCRCPRSGTGVSFPAQHIWSIEFWTFLNIIMEWGAPNQSSFFRPSPRSIKDTCVRPQVLGSMGSIMANGGCSSRWVETQLQIVSLNLERNLLLQCISGWQQTFLHLTFCKVRSGLLKDHQSIHPSSSPCLWNRQFQSIWKPSGWAHR